MSTNTYLLFSELTSLLPSYAESQWYWTFYIIAVGHIVIMLTRAGRAFGLDNILSKRFPRFLFW